MMKRILYTLLGSLIAIGFAGCAPMGPSSGVPVRVAVSEKGGNNAGVLNIPLERYVMGVLSREVGEDWPIEALKAQAVASRTYVLYRKAHPRNHHYDVTADISDQVFEKRRRYPQSIVDAVSATEGETLQYQGEVLESFFHSACGGISESADHVWPGSHGPPLLSEHKDRFCQRAPSSHWEYQISRETLFQLLKDNGFALEEPWGLETSLNPSGRVTTVKINFKKTILIPGTAFRQILGNSNLKSTLFEIASSEDPIIFSGQGFGHGVGLCQWGAKGMAEEGLSYRDILEFYYPGAEISGLRPSKEGPSQEPTPADDEEITEIISNLPESLPSEE